MGWKEECDACERLCERVGVEYVTFVDCLMKMASLRGEGEEWLPEDTAACLIASARELETRKRFEEIRGNVEGEVRGREREVEKKVWEVAKRGERGVASLLSSSLSLESVPNPDLLLLHSAERWARRGKGGEEVAEMTKTEKGKELLSLAAEKRGRLGKKEAEKGVRLWMERLRRSSQESA